MSHAHSSPSVSQEAYLARGSDQATHVVAAVYYHSETTGTEMQVQVTGIRAGTHCQFWLTNASGTRLWVGSWIVKGGQSNWYAVWSDTPMTSVRSFDITGPAGQMLVKIPADSQ
jgi:hypothetical protein